MPTALRDGPYRVFFYSGDGAEPRHMHVERDDLEAKYWLDPDVRLAVNRGFSRKELRTIRTLIEDNVDDLRRSWDEHFTP
jgi:hypothetical protein